MTYKRTIAKLFNDKYASIKNYEVEKAIELGGAILTLKGKNEKMILTIEQLKEGLNKQTSKEFPPNYKLGETEPFRLCNFFWKKKDERQMELV
mgnify:CR=1 FL=1